METIKFRCTDPKQKEFVKAVRQNVKNYFKEKGISTKGNLALVFQTIAMLSFYLVPFILILTVSMNVWVMMGMYALIGIGMAGIGMCVMHDAAHGSYSNRKWVNKMLGGTMYLLGSNVTNWKIQHNVLHHAYTNIDGLDGDIASRGPIRLSEHSPLKKIHKYQYIHAFFFYGLMTLSKLVRDFTQLLEFNKAGLTHSHANPVVEYVRMVLVKILYVFVVIALPIIVTPFLWWQVILGFFLMHWVGGCILATTFQMAHVVEGAEQLMPNEHGVIEDEWAVHELRTTSNFAPNNLFLNWFVGGLNFQIEHHLFPNICHIHYRKISPIVQQTAKEYGYYYNMKPSFVNAFGSHIRRLKELGSQQPVAA